MSTTDPAVQIWTEILGDRGQNGDDMNNTTDKARRNGAALILLALAVLVGVLAVSLPNPANAARRGGGPITMTPLSGPARTDHCVSRREWRTVPSSTRQHVVGRAELREHFGLNGFRDPDLWTRTNRSYIYAKCGVPLSLGYVAINYVTWRGDLDGRWIVMLSQWDIGHLRDWGMDGRVQDGYAKLGWR